MHRRGVSSPYINVERSLFGRGTCSVVLLFLFRVIYFDRFEEEEKFKKTFDAIVLLLLLLQQLAILYIALDDTSDQFHESEGRNI